jgi:hypothetical protein
MRLVVIIDSVVDLVHSLLPSVVAVIVVDGYIGGVASVSFILLLNFI